MRIKAFSYFINNEALPYELKDRTVVVDAHNYFYDMYERSRLPFSFGSESNRFANVLRKNLSDFKEANLKCVFVFKGGSKDLIKKFTKKKLKISNPEVVVNDFILPIFANDICKQVLDEMSFDYVDCPLEAKHYCITLAKKFGCPVISQDIEYAISNVSYIPRDEMLFDKRTNSFKCLKFNLDIVLRKYRLREDMLVFFIVLADTDSIPENHFTQFFQNYHIPMNPYSKILTLIKWLAGYGVIKLVQDNILKTLNPEYRDNFISVIQNTVLYIKKIQEGIPTRLFLYGDRIRVTKNDPMWFEKGVLTKYIAKPYIDLYYSEIYLYKRTIISCEGINEYLLSTDIIVYAYNLLTDYTKDQFSLNYCTGEMVTLVDTKTLPFPKPQYACDNSVFENGWDEIKTLGLFEHFLKGTMTGLELKYLEQLTDDAKLLMISLTYYTVKSPNETLDEFYSILVSYIMLGIVFEDRDDVNIPKTDYKLAIDSTRNYFQLDEAEIVESTRNLMYPLNEFQHCLEQMNHLNALCGYPYKPTVYSKTYNGTFVCKVLHSLKTKDLDREDFFVNILKLPLTVYDYIQNLSVIHERLISSIEN